MGSPQKIIFEGVEFEALSYGSIDAADAYYLEIVNFSEIVLREGTKITIGETYEYNNYSFMLRIPDTQRIWSLYRRDSKSYFIVENPAWKEPVRFVNIVFEENWGRLVPEFSKKL